jgi:hypothetical protein
MSAMTPLVGLWECSVVGAAAAVHLWSAGGSALLLEGRRRRLPTRGRPHWSRAFNNAGDGRSVERGGDDKDGSARDGSARDGELVDSRGREAEASTQQPASEREANGRKAALADFLLLLGLGNPDLGRHDAVMAFGVVAPPLRRRGRHCRCMTFSSSSSSPGGLVATDNDDDDETTLKRLATAFLEDYLHARFSGCGTLHQWAGGIEELLILEVKSLQRKICKECCFVL